MRSTQTDSNRNPNIHLGDGIATWWHGQVGGQALSLDARSLATEFNRASRRAVLWLQHDVRRSIDVERRVRILIITHVWVYGKDSEAPGPGEVDILIGRRGHDIIT